MASKIFTGNMPELMEKILNNLNHEFYSLYSCALVCRHWCKMSIPILWQDPFSYSYNEKRSLFISNYFSSLKEDEKFVLKNCNIYVGFSKTLFDYAIFLKVLDLYCLEHMIKLWLDFQLGLGFPFLKKSKAVYRMINLLFKLFIKSGATLYKLDLSSFECIQIKPEIFYSLQRNEKFFSQLQDLSLRDLSKFSIESAVNLLMILAKNARKISSLYLEIYTKYDPQVFQALISIIKSQEQLRLFRINSGDGEDVIEEYNGIISALTSQKQSLQEIILEYCEYSVEFEVLMNCENLEILRIDNSDYILLNISGSKINTLEVTDQIIKTSPIVSFLEKSGTLLQRLKLICSEISEEESHLLKALISKFLCPNLTYLYMCVGTFSENLELISKLQKLQYFTLWFEDNISEEEVKKFAEVLPLTLQYLDLIHTPQLNSYLDIWLNNCHAPLKKILIKSFDETRAKALIEFCMRKRTLNYVGVSKYSDLNDNIKKEMEKYVKVVPFKSILVDY
ncbi:hypothetical protein C2G38_2250052, partial [Gigaspora rosea]